MRRPFTAYGTAGALTGAALLCNGFAWHPAAAAQGEAAQVGGPRFAPAYGETAPPAGFLDFCRREPAACATRAPVSTAMAMTAARWQLVRRVNSYVNLAITPLSDKELYGTAEHWAYPSDAGDCEDYALLKQRYLEQLGFPRSALLITVVLDERNDGHAVLMLATNEGDFILDNRDNAVRRWSEDGRYVFLKRQSGRNPRTWVSLIGNATLASGLLSGSGGD